jgi:hypothetical protein
VKQRSKPYRIEGKVFQEKDLGADVEATSGILESPTVA